ncbi:MAG: hypothetical protein JWM57_2159 [Phycisphaerales bacterium]|nr:hypothetical protein [Phycisphaerales bacterium]
MLRCLIAQEFSSDSVSVRQIASTRRVVDAVEHAVDVAWRTILARPGVRLFDGPICRFEAFHVVDERLVIDLSRTSYRIFVGTNFCHPEFADTYGVEVMANSMGVSAGLLTADGYWMMGRRNASVAYYPGRVHPFAGSIELADEIDLFANARRELREELNLTDATVDVTRLLGLVEDTALRHPESIFLARTTLTHDAVAAGLDADEHDGIWSSPATPDATAAALRQKELTPVARAVLLLGGRHLFGEGWFQTYRIGQFGEAEQSE